MNKIWDKIEDLALQFIERFSRTGEQISADNKDGWQNYLFNSQRYRRAHVEIVDYRTTKNIYILHTTIFPHYNDPSPIYGFDAICGRNKITGAFHDFSNGGQSDHYMMTWFGDKTKDLTWSKPRDLPQWAQQIFSENMIAAGNLHDVSEVGSLYNIALESLDYYLENVGLSQTCGSSYVMAQNRYCYYQKQNPLVAKSMISMGIPEPIIIKFIDDVLFPEYTKY